MQQICLLRHDAIPISNLVTSDQAWHHNPICNLTRPVCPEFIKELVVNSVSRHCIRVDDPDEEMHDHDTDCVSLKVPDRTPGWNENCKTLIVKLVQLAYVSPRIPFSHIFQQFWPSFTRGHRDIFVLLPPQTSQPSFWGDKRTTSIVAIDATNGDASVRFFSQCYQTHTTNINHQASPVGQPT